MSAPLSERLAEHGIRLHGYAPGEHRTTCPECSQQRRKKTDPCLAVKIDHCDGAAFHCHHCGHSGNVPGLDGRAEPLPRRTAYRKPAPPETVERPDTLYSHLEARGISRATVDALGIFNTVQWFPQTKQEEPCIAFPYVRHGEVVNHKYRTTAKDFRQDKDALPTLYNVDAAAGADTVIFAEGEMDVATFVEAGFPAVVSLPVGAPPVPKDGATPNPDTEAKRYEALSNCMDDLAHVRRFILAGDMDGPGRLLTDELARRLGRERCWRVEWPTVFDAQLKDANEAWCECGPEAFAECVAQAVPFPIAGIHEANDYEAEYLALYHGEIGRGLSTGWTVVDDLYTVRPGDLTVVTGVPNSGKSEWIDALMVNLARLHGWRFGLCSFENMPSEHISKLGEKHASAPFMEGPTPRMPEADALACLRWVNGRFWFIRADDEAPTIDWILEKARALVFRYGIHGLVIDPWNEIEHKRPGTMTETEYTSDVLGKLRRFAQANDVHVWLVAHPTKMRNDNGGPPPVPGLYDISGSAHFANKADFGVTIHRPNIHEPITEVHVKKVRRKWLGQRGMATLRYLRTTGEYSASL